MKCLPDGLSLGFRDEYSAFRVYRNSDPLCSGLRTPWTRFCEQIEGCGSEPPMAGISRGTAWAKVHNPALRGPRHFAPGNDRPGQDRGTAWAKAPRRSIGASGIRVSRLCPPCGCASLALNEAAAREGQMRADQMGFLRIVMPLWLIVGA